jgi:uncharacterized protein (TIGR00730 family)
MADQSPTHSKIITVFGSSRCQEGSAIYQEAYALGKQLAGAGYIVCNGGYEGAMGAVSRGAHEAGGHVIGITMNFWRGRPTNAWLREEIETETLFSRLEALITRAAGYVVVNGGGGTLTEFSLVWSMTFSKILEPRPIILLGEQWRPVLESYAAHLDVHAGDLEVLQIAPTPAEAVALLQKAFGDYNRR